MSAISTLQDAQLLIEAQAELLACYRSQLASYDRSLQSADRINDLLDQKIKVTESQIAALSATISAMSAQIQRGFKLLGQVNEVSLQNHNQLSATIISLVAVIGSAQLADQDELQRAVCRLQPAALAWLDQYVAQERDRKSKEDGGD